MYNNIKDKKIIKWELGKAEGKQMIEKKKF